MAITLSALKSEIDSDPTALGYAGKNDQEVADLLNTLNPSIRIDRDIVSTWEVIEATVPSEWASLSADEKNRYGIFASLGTINLKGTNIRNAFGAMFAAGTTTRANLIAIQKRDGTRAEQLFGSGVGVSLLDVHIARRL